MKFDPRTFLYVPFGNLKVFPTEIPDYVDEDHYYLYFVFYTNNDDTIASIELPDDSEDSDNAYNVTVNISQVTDGGSPSGKTSTDGNCIIDLLDEVADDDTDYPVFIGKLAVAKDKVTDYSKIHVKIVPPSTETAILVHRIGDTDSRSEEIDVDFADATSWSGGAESSIC